MDTDRVRSLSGVLVQQTIFGEGWLRFIPRPFDLQFPRLLGADERLGENESDHNDGEGEEDG